MRPSRILMGVGMALVLAVSATGYAQGRRGQGGPGGGFGFGGGGFQQTPVTLVANPAVQEELALTDDQKAEITKISQSLRPMRGQGGPGGAPGAGGAGGAGGQGRPMLTEEERAKRQAEREKAIAEAEIKIGEVLEEAQFKRLLGIYAQVGGPQALTHAKIAAAIKINEEQLKKIKDAIAEGAKKRDELFASLRPQGGAQPQFGSPEFQEAMAKAREEGEKIRTATTEKVNAVLSDEQKKALEELKGEKFELPAPQFGPGRGAPGGPGGERPRRPQRNADA